MWLFLRQLPRSCAACVAAGASLDASRRKRRKLLGSCRPSCGLWRQLLEASRLCLVNRRPSVALELALGSCCVAAAKPLHACLELSCWQEGVLPERHTHAQMPGHARGCVRTDTRVRMKRHTPACCAHTCLCRFRRRHVFTFCGVFDMCPPLPAHC